MRQAHAEESKLKKGHEMTLTKEQRKHLLYAFGWHKDYLEKLHAKKPRGTSWQDCRRMRDEELKAAGIENLFADDFELVS
jgi:hypothetical protein